MPERDLLLVGAIALLGMGGLLLVLYLVGVPPLTASWRWGPLTVVIPLGLSVLLSVALTVLLNILLRSR